MRERSNFIDALKGAAILMVVVGHALQRASAFGLIAPIDISPYLPYSGYVTMPLFFSISGYLSFRGGRMPTGKWLLSKAKMLLVPWMMWTLVNYALVHDGLIPTEMPFLQYVKSQLVAPSLWFFVVLFLCYTLLMLGLRLGGVWLPILGLAVVVLPIPWLDSLAWYWWWFLGGYALARFPLKPRVRRIALSVGVVGYLLGLALPVTSTAVPLRLLMALCYSLAMVLFVGLLMRLAPSKLLRYLGVHTFVIYAGEFLFVQLVFLHSWVNVLITTVLAIAGSLALERLLSLSPLTDALFLGGRKLPRVVRAET
ncbi:MAG: acyltransferase family protein [Coriobacteriia bacterium]